MWNEDDLVVHESLGVCRVTEIQKKNRPPRDYYVLAPLYDKNSILYVPVDSQQMPLRPVMSQNEALSLIEQIPDLEDLKFVSLSDEKLQAATILSSGDQLRLAQLAKTMYHLQLSRSRSKSKNTFSTDRGILRQAERLLFGELAIALDLPIDQVPEFISQQLNTAASA